MTARLLKNPFGTGQHSTLGDQERHQNGQQDGQKGRPARPQQATCLREAASAKAGEAALCSVRRASKRRENKAGGPFGHAQGMLFEHPVRLNLGVLISVENGKASAQGFDLLAHLP